MDQLYIDIEINTVNNETEIFTSISSFMALYVYRYLQIPKNVKLNFVRTQLLKSEGKLKLRSEVLKRELTDECILLKETANIQAIRDLKLPIYAKEGNTYIAGMCAVCRALVARQNSKEFDKLLGFKKSCLLAPSESSIWTRFCELDTIKALSAMIMRVESGESLMEMPQEVVRFEHHMNEPVRMHNIYKLAREQANLTKKKRKERVIIECSVPKEELPIEHRFAEGIAFTIADLILFPIMAMIFEHCPHMLEYFPLTHSWLAEIDGFDPRCRQLLLDLHLNEVPAEVTNTKVLLSIPTCSATSLYKSDPKRYKPRNRIYTEQSVVDEALAKLQPLLNECHSNSTHTYGAKQIDWNLIEPTHAQSSALPVERLQRKREQLENLANAVVSLARAGDRIVDFCSGTGHLGILLALQLPQCTIILMENKAISLERAKQRALELKLTNLLYYQCNIDYYMGAFDVGASLHACGSATDIVLQKCQSARAKFVCCPCCYGALQPMPHIQYPLSRRFAKLLNEREYLHLAHTADQAHELGVTDCKPQLTLQGQLCMDIIDTDRRLKAEEQGYEVIVTRLQPEQCTPKNRLLVGRLP